MKKNTQIQKVEEKAPVFNIETLINQAVAKDVSVESLSRLLDMRKELKAEWAKEQFDKCLAAFQGECPTIKKTKSVKTNLGKVAYVYAPIDSIVNQVKPTLQKYGFSYSTNMEIIENATTKIKVTIKITHASGHSEMTEMTVPLGNKTDIMSNSQVVAAAQTFAKRYAFCNAFGILTGDEDNDAKLQSAVDSVGIDEADVKYIDNCTKQEDLLKLCSELKRKYPKNLKTLLNLYTIRKAEIENIEVEKMNEEAAIALNK